MPLKRFPLPSEHTIARFCRAGFFDNGRLQPTAFQLRLFPTGKREEYLSVNSLDILHVDKSKALQQFKDLCGAKGLKVKPKTGVATLNVGSLIRYLEEKQSIGLSVLNGLKDDEPSYSGIFGYPADQDFISELILEIVQETIQY